MMALRTAIFTLAAFALAAPGAAFAKDHRPPGKQGHAHKSQGPSPKKAGPIRAKPCPPGLAKKNTGCLPPGQWRKGDRLPDAWVGQFIAYAALPEFYRNRHPVHGGHRYIYRDGRVFVIDAPTRVILDVILR